MVRQRGGAKRKRKQKANDPHINTSKSAGTPANSADPRDPEEEKLKVNGFDVRGEQLSDKVEVESVPNSSSFGGRNPEIKQVKRARIPLPTTEEADHLRETSNLFASNVITLEIQELLKEVYLDYESRRISRLYQYIDKIKGELLKMKSRSYEISKHNFKGVKAWPIKPLGDSEFTFEKPEAINVVGSFETKMITKPFKEVDLAIKIPNECFEQRDFLNFRYHDKRLAYLHIIGRELAKQKLLCEKVDFQDFLHDSTKPILVVHPAEAVRVGSFTLRIIPIISNELFPLKRFKPVSCKLRVDGSFMIIQINIANVRFTERPDEETIPTPEYNMSLLEDVEASSCIKHCELLKSYICISQSFKETCHLIKIWCRQRNLSNRSQPNSFHDMLQIFLAIYLLQQRILNKNMSTQQMFRKLINFISETDLTKQVLRMETNDDANVKASGFDDEAFQAMFPINLIAPCGRLNLAWRVTSITWKAVQDLAISTRRLLEAKQNSNNDGRTIFESIFTTRLKFWQLFDRYLRVKLPEEKSFCEPKHKTSRGMEWRRYLWISLEKILEKALVETGRVTSFNLFVDPNSTNERKIDDSSKPLNNLIVGMKLDLIKAYSKIDKGPNADDSEKAAEFRQFWKSRAELRRFKDGSILEAVIWRADQVDIEGDYCGSIAAFILSQHEPFSSLQKPCEVIGSLLFPSVKMLVNANALPGYSINDSSEEVVLAFGELQKRLRYLNLPLRLVEVSAADPVLRHAGACIPSPHPLCYGSGDPDRDKLMRQLQGLEKGNMIANISNVTYAISIVLRFETSGKWPDDVEAVEIMKFAFLFRIMDQLEEHFPKQQICIVDHNGLNVLLCGYAFRLTIRHERTIQLLRGIVKPNLLAQAASEKVKKQSTPILSLISRKLDRPKGLIADALERDTIRFPLLHSQLNALHTSTGETGGARIMESVVRLAKFWAAGHRVFGCISEVVIELIVASLYLHPEPYDSPKSATTGLLQFLDRLGNWDWTNTPLIVDTTNSLEHGDISDIYSKFLEERNRSEQPYMYIVTPDDRYSGWNPYWTMLLNQSKDSFDQIQKLAKASLELIEQVCSRKDSLEEHLGTEERLWQAVFYSDIKQSGHNLLLHLIDNNCIPEDSKSSLISKGVPLFKNLIAYGEKELLVGYNPVTGLATAIFEEFGWLFDIYFNPYFGKEIGLTFRADAITPSTMKVAYCGCTKPFPKDRTKILPNLDEIIEELAILGKGIIQSIEIASCLSSSEF